MVYSHGVYIQENPTSLLAPITADNAVQIIVGCAPVNLTEDPSAYVNKLALVNNYAEAVEKLGFSYSFDKFTLCQSIDACFRVYNVAPMVFINVLDPDVHTASVNAEDNTISNDVCTVEVEGILLSTVVVQIDAETYDIDDDYTLAFNDDGHLVIHRVSTGSIPSDAATITLDYDYLDPSLVDADDIIGGYDSATGTYTGLELITRVFPELGIVPALLLAPGYSHEPEVGIAMLAKTTSINGSFRCEAILDIDSSSTGADLYDEIKIWKDTNGYVDPQAIACWPMVMVGSKKYYYSAIVAALTAFTDANNDNVPFVSPSNKSLRITATVLDDAGNTPVVLDQLEANTVNGYGVITTLNINGWKCWGNNTTAYPDSSDVKDRWLPVRRMFNWWGNTFILTYFQLVDDPMNLRLIETLVDSENIRANGYKGRDQIAGAKIEFNIEENPVTDILDGKIRFKQYLTPFPPAETIINTLEFDPSALVEYLGQA